jgi:hypothetical protein
VTEAERSHGVAAQFAAHAYSGIVADMQRSLDAAATMRSFAEGVVGRLGALGLESYRDPLRHLVDNIDFEALERRADDAACAFEQELEHDDDTPGLGSVRDALQRAELESIREAVDVAVAEAIKKTLAANPRHAAQIPEWIAVLLIPILCMVVGTIGQPLFARWLAQRDAQTTASAPRPEAPIARPISRFNDVLVVKADNVPLRMGPSGTQQTLVLLAQGQIVTILSKKGRWARVRYVDPLHDGVSYTGWIKIRQTRAIEAETARLIWCALTEPSADITDLCRSPN